jgi:3-mercaptopyruvate sulfurtransferase SseA
MADTSLAVSLEEAEPLFFSQQAIFIDARSDADFRAGHIQGALNLPWNEFDIRFQQVMTGISHESTIVTYCDGEACGLSHELAVALLGKGYPNVRVLLNGWTIWQQSGLPTDRD